MIRGLRTASTISQRFLRPYSSIPDRDGSFRVQHVRIHRPFLKTWRIKRSASILMVLGFILYRLGGIIDDEVEDVNEEVKPRNIKEVIKQVHKVAEGEKIGPDGNETTDTDTSIETTDITDEEDGNDDSIVPKEQPEDAMFIPLGWPRKLPQVYYKGSDPEWQSFLEFARNMDKAPAVKRELAAIISGSLSQNRSFQKFLGEPIKIRQYWLDIDFPYGPPTEYERAGIEITDDYVAWVTRRVEPYNVARMKNALQPTPLMYSLWESSKVIWTSNLAKLKKALDIDSAPPPEKPRFPPGFAPFLEGMSEGTSGESNKKPPVGNENADKQQYTPPRDLNEATKQLLPIVAPSSERNVASRVFKKTLSSRWGRGFESSGPPRGTILVSGLVEMKGPKGVCLIEVNAAYDPQEGQWAHIQAGVRRLQPSTQKPMGGA